MAGGPTLLASRTLWLTPARDLLETRNSPDKDFLLDLRAEIAYGSYDVTAVTSSEYSSMSLTPDLIF